MISQAFVLTERGLLGTETSGATDVEASLFVYRNATGAISFLSDDIGRKFVDSLLSGACVVTARGAIVPYDQGPSIEAFLAVAISRSGICFYGPDDIFLSEVQKVSDYFTAQQKAGLYKKYGRSFDVPPRPILDTIGIEGLRTAISIDWLLTHCRAFTAWRCITGAERQPLIFGRDRQSKLDALAALCDTYHVGLTPVDTVQSLPNW